VDARRRFGSVWRRRIASLGLVVSGYFRSDCGISARGVTGLRVNSALWFRLPPPIFNDDLPALWCRCDGCLCTFGHLGGRFCTHPKLVNIFVRFRRDGFNPRCSLGRVIFLAQAASATPRSEPFFKLQRALVTRPAVCRFLSLADRLRPFESRGVLCWPQASF
jgi:hypothetical protein